MKHSKKRILPLILAVMLVFSVLGTGETVQAAGQIYINDGQNVYSGDISSAYAIGGSGVSSVGGAYAITGSGVQQIGQTTSGNIPSGEDDGTTVRVKASIARVGLYYYYSSGRNTALSSASLENKVGSGYQFGYYDNARVFHSLGNTAETQITMVPKGESVGAYHIKLPTAYNDFNTALSFASQYADGFPAYKDGTYYTMIGNYQSTSAANSARAALGVNGEVFSGSDRSVAVTRTGTSKILFLFDCGTSANLAVHPVSNTKAITWFKNNTYYGDFEYFRYVSDKLTVINVLDLEDYVKGVVPIEMTNSWPIEALKAQAVCARSYFATNYGNYSMYGFDVTADTYSQAYLGTSRASDNSDAAVDATAGEYVTYNGSVCTTFYFSSDGGGTENSENIFTSALPYCRGVVDPFEADVPDSMNAKKSWHYEYTGVQLASKLSSAGYSIGNIVSVQPTYSDTNNVIKITLSDANGKSVTLTKTKCYSVLGLPSIHYSIQQNGGTFVIDGGGWGHNVGMSQFGAYSMAKFHNLNYRQILRYYFTNINISKGIMA